MYKGTEFMSENHGAFLLCLVCDRSRKGGADGYAELQREGWPGQTGFYPAFPGSVIFFLHNILP